MKNVTPAEMRELDRRTIEEFGTPGEVLMERAGHGLAESIFRRKAWLGERCRGVTAIAGRGNNGGDAFVAARLIHESGVPVQLLTTCTAEEYKGDAAIHLQRMSEAGVAVTVLATPEEWDGLTLECKDRIIVDGLLGTGTKGAARGAPEAAIRWINRQKNANVIVAIDIPSGLDGDSGTAEGEVVFADWTVTMAFPKTGLTSQSALEYVGNLEVVDIGIPEEYARDAGVSPEFLARSEACGLMPTRRAISHKGSHGSSLIIAGSGSYPGAAVLAAMGAVRSGAGLVTVLTAENASSAVTAAVPEAIVRSVRTDSAGAMVFDDVVAAIQGVVKYSSIVIGPGMTDSEATLAIVAWVLGNESVPLVLDADALNVIAGGGRVPTIDREDVIMTPHPGEAARLLGISPKEVQADRRAASQRLTTRYPGVMVLKGAGTLISRRDEEFINLTGNAGMAKGGSGDVLAGLIGGLLAQGLSVFDAARLGVYTHGRAGDIAAFRGSMQGMTATDTAACLSDAFATLV